MADSALYTAAVAVYDFENNANATKGSNLTATGSPAYSTTGEAQGTYWAGALDGGDYFSITSNTFNFTGSYSVSAWVSFSNLPYYGPICSFYYSSNGSGWAITQDDDYSLRVQHRQNWSNTNYDFTSANFTTSTRYHIVVSHNASTNECWAYVSTTSFGNILNTHIDAATDPGNDAAGGTLYVARHEMSDTNLQGYIDEVCFWNSAITSTDAEAIFNARDGGTSWRETGEASSTPTLKRRLNILLRLCLSTFNLIWRCFK